MSEPYLILHKVRGEPAFDIAEPIEIGDEEGWIIPTSGHRAYPYWHKMLWEIDNIPCPQLDAMSPTMPESLPDHYAASESRSGLARAASDILSLIGLKPKAAPPSVKRRTIPNG